MMRTRDHVSLALVLAILFLTIFCLLCRADVITTNTAPDGVNIETTIADEYGVYSRSTTTAYVINTNADYVAGESSLVLVTPELQVMANQMFGGDAGQLLHAIQLQMGKYDLDMQTDSGRRAWHGKLIGEEVSTNYLCKVMVYSNELTGAVWRYRLPFHPKPMVKSWKRKTTYTTNGIPARLAAARSRRAAQIDGETTVTNVEHTANAQLTE